MLKALIKYSVSTLLAASLLYWAFSKSDLRWTDIYQTAQSANYQWIIISVIIALISHLLRALRWAQLLGAIAFNPGTTRTFTAVLIGYFANFIVPRMGEVSRCGSLQKTANIPFEKSFGTVITERIVDLLGLAVLVGLTFIVEWEPIQQFLFPNFHFPPTMFLAGLGAGAMACLGLIWILRDRLHVRWEQFAATNKVGQLLQGWFVGILSIKEVENPAKFILYTILIWVAYFANTYTLLLAFPISASLSLSAGLTVLVMGTFGMATPTQGGIGAYHSLVASALSFYLIPVKDATVLATFFHGTQMATILLFGGLSFIITFFLPQKNAGIES
jgi:glycosyltransferase 2 family protein